MRSHISWRGERSVVQLISLWLYGSCNTLFCPKIFNPPPSYLFQDYDPYEENPGLSPFSEPETQIMRKLALTFDPHIWVNVHSGMEVRNNTNFICVGLMLRG